VGQARRITEEKEERRNGGLQTRCDEKQGRKKEEKKEGGWADAWELRGRVMFSTIIHSHTRGCG
jgi:hypothetical protein